MTDPQITPPGADAPPSDRHPGARDVQYKGAPLEAERGPGLGCFWTQLVVLAIAVVITPLSVVWGWPEGLSAALLFLVVILLLFTGQTIIFLLRLVAADRRAEGRRRPLASATRTVGELEDARLGPPASNVSDPAANVSDPAANDAGQRSDTGGQQQGAAGPSSDPGLPAPSRPGPESPPGGPDDRGPVRQ